MFYRVRETSIDPRLIWAIALPAMVTNVATALIGVGDMWIVGQLDDAPTQGAVDVGARIFAILFTVMNFLKTGTTGLVAQAGARDGAAEQVATLLRGLTIAAIIGFGLLALRPLLLPLLLDALGAQADVLEAASMYAGIRYWTAPGVMFNLALVGYLVGQRRMTTVLIVEVAYNLLNVGLGLWLVLGVGSGIAGIGWSSFVAEYAKLAVLIALVAGGPTRGHIADAIRGGGVLARDKLLPFLSVNRDLFLRTVVLMLALAALTRISAERGAVVLAANGIMYQMFVLSALFLDGFENAAQVIHGERYGAKDRDGFLAYTGAILKRGLMGAAIAALGFELFADPLLASFAATPEVARTAQDLKLWLVLIPFAGVASFVLDGVFVGASWTRAMLLSMAGAALVYAAMLRATWPMGSDGLWLSFVVFLAARAALQLALIPRLVARDLPDANVDGGHHN
ncbi:MATE family efflux transporter [Qipengyuania oceanensis]|uniref:MATE family efflux transporter n=1 Tax=Qipengyuania oceanensis TaxID=1463597 RepID=A0A844YI84_9SPHN|nr:MATE family efflux transporter [Qipengyuania oceanensis]MXO63637.1 MATE family efflux transporter [Qipengyuania oceanensis]